MLDLVASSYCNQLNTPRLIQQQQLVDLKEKKMN